MPKKIETQHPAKVRAAALMAEWYALGRVDAAEVEEYHDIVDAFADHYRFMAADFYDERRPDLPNVRSVWPDFTRYYEVAASVIKGAALLDRARPFWWLDVDVATLDLASDRECVIAQLWQDKDWGAAIFDLMPKDDPGLTMLDWSTDHGFDCGSGMTVEQETARYALLTACWIAAVEKRIEKTPTRDKLSQH